MKKKEQKERNFERLVERQRQTIYSVCYLFANERQQADDLVQEVLIRLWKGFDSFEGRSSEKTWVYRVALNTCVTADQKQRRRLDTSPLEMDVDLFAEEEHNPAASRLHQRIRVIHHFDVAEQPRGDARFPIPWNVVGGHARKGVPEEKATAEVRFLRKTEQHIQTQNKTQNNEKHHQNIIGHYRHYHRDECRLCADTGADSG